MQIACDLNDIKRIKQIKDISNGKFKLYFHNYLGNQTEIQQLILRLQRSFNNVSQKENLAIKIRKPQFIQQIKFRLLQYYNQDLIYQMLKLIVTEQLFFQSFQNYNNSKKKMSMGTVSDLVEYLNLNKHIFQKEKNSREYMERVMSLLSHQNMQILQREFELYPKGLELPTFIYLMKKLYTPQNQISKYYFASDLIKFFQAIDINGDGHLEWSQFTEYIIQNIRKIDKPNYKNKAFQQNEVISSAYSKISNEYRITSVVDPGTLNCIKKVVYVARDQKYYLLEAGTNIIRILDTNFKLLDYLEITKDSHHSFIIDFDFDKSNMVFCAIFQNSARFCNLKILGNVKTCNQCQSKKIANYHRVQYLPIHQYWAFLSKTGELKLSTAVYRSRTVLDYNLLIVLKQHESMVTQIVQIEEPQYIATASMDGNVKFYCCYLKKTITLQHISEQKSSAINSRQRKGILGIDYTRQFGSYLLSWGFCGSIFVYALQVSLAKGYIGKYKEHNGNLVAAKFLKSFPYVLSFDDRLSMRIWDFRKLTTMQVINCEKNFINPSRLQVIPELSEILVCEKKITQFKAPSLDQKSKQINQFHSIFDFRIASTNNQIFLFTSGDVRIYNFVTGALEKVFTKLNETNHDTNITAAEFGYKCRKFFVGDAAGFVRQYCSQTGDFLQHVEPGQENQYENKAIVRIIFLKQHSLLIVCSLDGRILIYERDSESQFQLLRDIRDTHYELTAAEASARYCTLATGSEDGTVNIWNLQKFTFEGVIVLKSKIVNISFSPVHPILIVSEESGVISFFYVRPYEQVGLRNKCFLKLINCNAQGQIKRIKTVNFDLVIDAYLKKDCPLVQNSKEDQHLLCIIGNQDGSIELINITQILQKYHIQQNHQIFSIKKSVKAETHSLKSIIQNQRKKVLQSGYSNEGAPEIYLKDFKTRIKIEGHKNEVDRVSYVKQSSVIISTCTSQKKMKLWSMDGNMNGCIDFLTFKKTSWRVAEMNFYKKLQAIDTTIYSMKLIENKQLKSDQEEFIKVNLLLNQFMDSRERQDYIKWINVLKRFRSRHRIRRPIATPDQDHYDVRDQIQKFDNVNNPKKELQQQQQESNSVEFNIIYNKLVSKIKNKIEKTELPTIAKIDTGESIKEKTDQKQGVAQLIASLRKTFKNGKEDERKYQKEITAALNRKTKTKKKQNNLLYQSLLEVRKNIEAMEKKPFGKFKKVF